MGKFNGLVTAQFTPPKTWILEKPLSFTLDLNSIEINILKDVGANITTAGKITCKKGMKTDLASVPRALWNLISPWDVARAAIIHDHLYAVLRKYYNDKDRTYSASAMNIWKKGRALSDKVFLEGMHAAEPSVPRWKKYAAYYAVRAFGRWPASSGS
tara:strand:+ start:228 stop:698 length:471 start_codon:yes stop_codon:yes gene_type:complete